MADDAEARSMSDDDREERLRELHALIAATAELPVDAGASRWLGEAEAVASDVADGDAPPAAIETRVAQVEELLENVGATGHPEADEHVAAALEIARELLTEQ